jgi:UDP-glucose:(heptosyl)LPS alpha-1,3-glucosyltransferase
VKLAVVIAAYNRTGGLERVSVEYARGLRALGHDVTVFAQTVQRERADDGITFVRVGGVRGQMALRAATFPIAATHAMDGTNFDNIVAFGSVLRRPAVMREPGCHRSWWEFANATWPVTTFDGLRRRLNPHHRFVMAWDKRVLGRGIPRAVLAAGAWAADDIKRFYPAVSSKVSILPDGVNLDEFSFDPDGRDDLRKQWGSGPILFTVATELRRKGLGTLFEAFRLVRGEEPNAQLVVGGRVPEGDVRALAAHHRVHDAVRAVGFVRDLRAAYSAADAMVFPTMFDPWGLPVVEALACGTPVAASARAGASGVLIEGVTGTAIPDPTDAAVVASGILRALRLERDRERARASVEHLSWDTVVGDLERVCEETAG